MNNKFTRFVCKRKKILTVALACSCVTSMVFASLFANGQTVYAAENTHSVSDTERITSRELSLTNPIAEDFYKEVTLQKAGTTDEVNRVTYSGLVPYGTGMISLGTYDMSTNVGLENPLFVVLPQQAWNDTMDANTYKDKFFKVYLTSGEKQVIYHFRQRADGENQSMVFVGNNDSDGSYNLGGRYLTNGNQIHKYANVAAILPYLYNGTGYESGVKNEKKESFAKPTPLGFYYNNGNYYNDFIYNYTLNQASYLATETSSGSGEYRYIMNDDSTKFTAEELKNITVSIAFEKGTVAKDEAWVMFTSIAGKKLETDYSETKTLDSKGDYFSLTESTTITLNKKVSLADNDVKTKVFEFETAPLNGSTAEIADVKVTLKGENYSLVTRYTHSGGDEKSTMMLATFKGNNEAPYWYSQQRHTTSVISVDDRTSYKDSSFIGRSFGYYFDGLVCSNDYVTDGMTLKGGSVVAPRFAMYYDKATNAIYTDVGRSGEAKGQTIFDGASRWQVLDLDYLSHYAGQYERFFNEQLEVSVEVALASGVTSTMIKFTNLDGQSLERESIESAQYKTVYHSYEAEEIATGDKFVGATCEIPALKDNGVMAQFSNVARSAYTVKVNGVETTEDSFTLAASNKIEYYVDGDLVDTIEFEAQALQLRMEHLGAAIRYDANDTTKSGIRYTVIVNKADYDALGDKTVTMGMLSVGTQYLADGEKVNINTGATKKVVNTTFTTEECTVVVEDGVEYYQMRICVMDIPNTDFAVEVTTVGYICINGNYFYTEQKSRSISYVAKAYVEDMKGKPGYMSGVEDFIVD